jgi:hypothetical protein
MRSVTWLILAAQFLAVALGFLAAWLWYKASTAQVGEGSGNPHEASLNANGIDQIATAKAQSGLNKQAAMVTALSVLFQAVVVLLQLIDQITCKPTS